MEMRPFNKLEAIASLLPFVLSGGLDLTIPPKSFGQGPTEEPCLWCKKLKIHNNSFCSAECCRLHRQSKKEKLNGQN